MDSARCSGSQCASRAGTPLFSMTPRGRRSPATRGPSRAGGGSFSARASPEHRVDKEEALLFWRFDLQTQEEDPELELLLTAARARRGVRLYPSNPHSKAVVNQVVFNREQEAPLDDRFDTKHFHAMFEDAAGRPSWKNQLRSKRMGPQSDADCWGPVADPRTLPVVPGGRRKFVKAPMTKSIVDDIVLGHDVDMSGTDPQRFDAMQALHIGAAGAPSWVPRHQGLGSTARVHRQRHAKLRRKAQQLAARLAATETPPKQAIKEPELKVGRRLSANALPLAVAKALSMFRDEKGLALAEAWGGPAIYRQT
ncbi:unnamed protein product [Symbiodinium pilosum]|uniref:Uncharacterized protein n=1 Tax=Symbiodinium pilosum TaxID=2952 RepID=A0A812WEX4_SYMPI|nr:unnamed protein product [Symbiodinium pilosum]